MPIPLCIDLDGTLIKSDSLLESAILFLKSNPFNLLLILFWLFSGIHNLKYQLACHVIPNPNFLPYSKTFLTYLQNEHASGRQLILVTAANQKIADSVASHLGIFSQVLASDDKRNLRGQQKRNFLNQMLGEKQYDYAGNDVSDLKVWASSRYAIVVNASQELLKKVSELTQIEKYFPNEKNTIRTILKALRPHQYLKNILIFLPLFTSQQYLYAQSLLKSVIAFAAFCLLASCVYLINDLLDIEVDRQHPTKQTRPFAAGDLPIGLGCWIVMVLLSLVLAISVSLNTHFIDILLGYFSLTLAYSVFLKKQLLLDVFVLAVLYTLRIAAGAAAITCEYSEWLLTFSIFFFLSLAFVKRYTEVLLTKKAQDSILLGRAYQLGDLTQLSIFGTVSGYASVLVFAFYINSNKVMTLYHHPKWLWLVCLLLLFWVSRIWMLTTRGEMHEDPVFFALKDKLSIVSLLTIIFIMFAASLP